MFKYQTTLQFYKRVVEYRYVSMWFNLFEFGNAWDQTLKPSQMAFAETHQKHSRAIAAIHDTLTIAVLEGYSESFVTSVCNRTQ